MRKIIFILILLLLINNAAAQEDWFYNSEALDINLKVSSEAVIKPASSSYNVKYVLVNISFVPQDDINQKILRFETEPEGKIENGAIYFRFDNPTKKNLDFGYDADIRTFNRIIGVREKIPFPIEEMPAEYGIYLQSGDIIDSDNKAITELASRLVEGEDDLFVAVSRLAAWTKNNIRYNLSTLTAEVSQKASWVLENRQGVCDELTSLFIAMLRSVGIPARFVSGIAYTDDPQFPEQWGAHGWAEVYFPSVGWVPFDVTYGEFGYVDPTHIKLRESFDSDEASTEYRWLGRDVDLEANKLDIKADKLSTIGRVESPISLKANILEDEVGFGSYNLVEAEIENLKDYYVSAEAYISKTEELEVLDGYFRQALLQPKEKKSVYWLLKVSDKLQKNFIYTFPVAVGTLWNSSSETSFTASQREISHSFDEMQGILKQKEEETRKVYSKNVNLDCGIDRKEFYDYENALISCSIKNIGNVFLKDLNICYEECKKIDLGIGRDAVVNFTVEDSAGKKDIFVRASNNDVSKTANIEFNVMDKPSVKIIDIKNPYNVSFEDVFSVEFELSKASDSNPIDVGIDFAQNGFSKSWNIEEFFESRKFVVKLDGKSLKAGRNGFNILVKYNDRNGREYETSAGFDIYLVNVTLWQKFQIEFFQFNRSLENLTVQNAVLIIMGIGVVFILVVWYVFRKKR